MYFFYDEWFFQNIIFIKMFCLFFLVPYQADTKAYLWALHDDVA